MSTITINKTEYLKLKREARVYRDIVATVASHSMEKPVATIVDNFRKTKKYSKAFLGDLRDGLLDFRRSSVWKLH